ncbi:MAG TPA: response regulator transcription factor [Dehalococcoidales bacterium]|nr:response regulator transcription factor [Dehalococcoidales bacterium]
MKVLIIESNYQVVRDISFCLQVRYPEVAVVSVGEERKGLDMIETESPDLVMVDSSLPNVDIFDLVSQIREFSDVPLIILFEAATDMDRARGLEMGADEYINKPFSPIELLARVKALLRRTQGFGFKPERFISIGGELTINNDTHEVLLSAGKRVKLTPIEYHLLLELVRNNGRVLTHSNLVEKVWGSEDICDQSYVKKYIYRLRSKLENDAGKPQMLLTERGIGYKFVRPI